MKTSIHSRQAPAAIGPYSQAVEQNRLVFCSGQIALDPASGMIVEGGIEFETRRVLQNLGEVLAAAGLDFRRRRQDDHLHDRSWRVRDCEPNLRRTFRAAISGALDGSSGGAATQGADRDRRDRA